MSSERPPTPEAERERIAAQIVAAAEGRVTVQEAMKRARIPTPQRNNDSKRRKVARKAKKIVVLNEKDALNLQKKDATPVEAAGVDRVQELPASAIGISSGAASVCSSLSQEQPSGSTHATSRTSNDLDDIRRVLNGSTPSSADASSSTKSRRRTSKQKHREDAEKRATEKRESKAIKVATTRIAAIQLMSPSNPKKVSQRQVVEETNRLMNTTISSKTVSRMVREGRIGTSPQKRGPLGDFSRPVMTALKGAFATYIKLEQAESKKQSTLNDLAKRVNCLVNAAGFQRSGNDLARRLKSLTADQYDIDEKNVQEHRRLQWTTHANLKAWFTQWENTLIELGFGRKKKTDGSEDHIEGSVVFFPGQTSRIINIDETDGSLDNTNGKRGGRKPMVFYAPDVAGGGTEASKSSYSPTIICGSNAAGEAIPPHFQLKTAAKTSERERLNIDFIAGCHDIYGKFGFEEKRKLPVTFGLNEKAGMNSVELEKYFNNSILPLYPDIENKPLKRVIAKVDSGPGRTNIPMLASLTLKGLYLVPGVPNTTGETQETDQNYGPFKSNYRANLSWLSYCRFRMNKTLCINDLPLLVFGGIDSVTKARGISNAFAYGFCEKACLSAWAKCGAVPLTMTPLSSKGVRHEIVKSRTGEVDKDLDPEGVRLQALEDANALHCSFLCTFGFDGTKLRKVLPTRSATKFELTVPFSKERIQAIQKAKTAGQLFHATHGRHLNSEDFFAARAQTERDVRIEELEAIKVASAARMQAKETAMAIIRQKGNPTMDNIKEFATKELKAIYKWKLGKSTTDAKPLMIAAILAAPEPGKSSEWTEEEEAELKALKEDPIVFKDTALAVSLKQTAKAVANNAQELDDADAKALMAALITRDRASGDPEDETARI